VCLAVCLAVCCAVCCNLSHLKVFFPHTSCIHSFFIIEYNLHREQSEEGRVTAESVKIRVQNSLLYIISEMNIKRRK
jgi:hypothetical protein